MTILLELPSDVEFGLSARARARGVTLEEYVREIVRKSASEQEIAGVDAIGDTQLNPDEANAILRKNALEAAVQIRELRKGVKLDRPEEMSLREYAHIGHRY